MRTFTEVATFLIFCGFVAFMTWTQFNNNTAWKESIVTVEKVKDKQKVDREFLFNAYIDTINHDANKITNTVIVTLDASTSFDAGNTADQITFSRHVSDRSKPKCADRDKGCTIDCIDDGDCIPLRNNCGEELYEPRCEFWDEDCNKLINECECIKFLEMEVDYQTDCEYLSMSHSEKVSFVKSEMKKQGKKYRPDKNLKYSWKLNEEKSSYVPLVKGQKLNVSSSSTKMTVELGEGEYLFQCSVTDPYGFRDTANKWVIIEAESNDFPVANINARIATTEESKAGK